MQIPIPHHDEPESGAAQAAINRNAFADARVFVMSLVGGPGCGKTTLIDATIERFMPDLHVGAIIGDGVTTHDDAERMLMRHAQVVEVEAGQGGVLNSRQIHDALPRIDLDWMDVLFIENVGALGATGAEDLGQNVTTLLLSVTSGDDKAEKHPALVQSADLVVLNKTDVMESVPFDLPRFRHDLARINPRAELIELSALRRQGTDRWFEWVKCRVAEACTDVSHWFG